MDPYTLTELIAEAERLDAEATSGPWKDDHVGNVRAILGVAHQVIIPRTFNDSAFIARSRTLLPLLVAVIKNQQRQIEIAILALENLEDPVLSDTISTTAEDALTEIIALGCQLEDVKPC